jgi:RNA polymerase sigma-70 factor (ECF subfamily)
MAREHEQITTIFNETYPNLCRFLESLLGRDNQAQDIAQESVLRLYQTEFGQIPISEARFWLFRVARNLALNELDKKRTRIKFWQRVGEVFRVRNQSPAELLELNEQEKAVRKLLDSLPEHQRSALLLREEEEMSYREIAFVLNVSESKIKIDIFRARAALRAEWQKREENNRKTGD